MSRAWLDRSHFSLVRALLLTRVMPYRQNAKPVFWLRLDWRPAAISICGWLIGMVEVWLIVMSVAAVIARITHVAHVAR
jgi:hypothetical protein